MRHIRYIAAGNYREFAQFCRDNSIHHSNAVYIDHPDKLKGLENPTVEWVGTYNLHPRLIDIEDELAARTR